jgi:hypothetical protein
MDISMNFKIHRMILVALLTATTLSWTADSDAATTHHKTRSVAHAKPHGAASNTLCKTTRVRTAKGYRSKRVCTAVARDPLLTSPINQNALTQPASAAPELKARTVPSRAYAVDGQTFFQEGRKFRVLGVAPGSQAVSSGDAKQKLQKALDSGVVTVEPTTVDESGVALALVRVNGRNVVDLIGATP